MFEEYAALRQKYPTDEALIEDDEHGQKRVKAFLKLKELASLEPAGFAQDVPASRSSRR